MKDLVEHSFSVFEKVVGTNDICLLKDLLFKAAECNRPHTSPSKWARVGKYRNHEKYEHSSIFLDRHMLHSGDPKREDFYATVSSTLLLLTEDNTMYLFERVYDHDSLRDVVDEEEQRVE